MRAAPFLFAISLLSTIAVHAKDDVIKTPLRKALNLLISAHDPLADIKRPGQNCNSERAVRCANMSTEVDQDYSDAKIQLNQLRSQVASALNKKEISQNPALLKEVRTVSIVLRCMYDKYDELSLECTSNHSGKIGNVVGSTPLEVNAYMSTLQNHSPNLMTLGPAYHLHSKEKRRALLIHELSHFCGTIDQEYYINSWGPGKELSTPFTQLKRKGNFLTGYSYEGVAGSSALNADNYAWWVIHGFCVPEFDCPRL